MLRTFPAFMTCVTALAVHVFFFSESIVSDESDLNCFKGHILNEEIDHAKVIYSRKQEESVSSQNQDTVIFLEMNLGPRSSQKMSQEPMIVLWH